MLTISPILTLISLIVIPLSGVLMMMVVKRSQKYFIGQQKTLGELNGHIEEMYTGHNVIKAFGHEKKAIEEFDEINERLYGVGWMAQFLSGLIMPIIEMYTGHNVIKAFGHEKKAIEEFDEINERLYGVGWMAQFLSGLIMPIINFIGNLGYVVVAVVGGILVTKGRISVGDIQAFIQYNRQFTQPIAQVAQISNIIQSTVASAVGGILVTKGRISVGDIQAFIQYNRQFTQPIAQVAQISNIIQSTVASAERVFELLDEEEVTPEPSQPIKIENGRGAVEFEHVKFGYREDRILINDMNIKAEPGQMVAIVGPTGAGKTTLVNLLLRFYEVNGGRILVDGVDITKRERADLRKQFGMVLQDTAGKTTLVNLLLRFYEVNGGRILVDGVDITKRERADLRKQFGMVLQDTWLFNGTIRDNIAYGKENATEEEIIAAAKAAHADHFIRVLPDGYNTILNEEVSNISQGQKQLLTIARALLADPEIMILDEATSSVDTRTELQIQNAMKTLMKGRTSFVIAHRLSTIREADVILVMKDGDVIETGNHETLMAQNGFYADLYNSQFSQEQEG